MNPRALITQRAISRIWFSLSFLVEVLGGTRVCLRIVVMLSA